MQESHPRGGWGGWDKSWLVSGAGRMSVCGRVSHSPVEGGKEEMERKMQEEGTL